uniref:Uncharacterized protein n=1 Tax=Corethron hystrix TaxID=216773 RepID=A0A7S1FP56_9STRA
MTAEAEETKDEISGLDSKMEDGSLEMMPTEPEDDTYTISTLGKDELKQPMLKKTVNIDDANGKKRTSAATHFSSASSVSSNAIDSLFDGLGGADPQEKMNQSDEAETDSERCQNKNAGSPEEMKNRNAAPSSPATSGAASALFDVPARNTRSSKAYVVSSPRPKSPSSPPLPPVQDDYDIPDSPAYSTRFSSRRPKITRSPSPELTRMFRSPNKSLKQNTQSGGGWDDDASAASPKSQDSLSFLNVRPSPPTANKLLDSPAKNTRGARRLQKLSERPNIPKSPSPAVNRRKRRKSLAVPSVVRELSDGKEDDKHHLPPTALDYLSTATGATTGMGIATGNASANDNDDPANNGTSDVNVSLSNNSDGISFLTVSSSPTNGSSSANANTSTNNIVQKKPQHDFQSPRKKNDENFSSSNNNALNILDSPAKSTRSAEARAGTEERQETQKATEKQNTSKNTPAPSSPHVADIPLAPSSPPGGSGGSSRSDRSGGSGESANTAAFSTINDLFDDSSENKGADDPIAAKSKLTKRDGRRSSILVHKMNSATEQTKARGSLPENYGKSKDIQNVDISSPHNSNKKDDDKGNSSTANLSSNEKSSDFELSPDIHEKENFNPNHNKMKDESWTQSDIEMSTDDPQVEENEASPGEKRKVKFQNDDKATMTSMTTAALDPEPPRSILASSKKYRRNRARRSVNFNSPEAAEFNHSSPSMKITPMCPSQIRKKYTIPQRNSLGHNESYISSSSESASENGDGANSESFQFFGGTGSIVYNSSPEYTDGNSKICTSYKEETVQLETNIDALLNQIQDDKEQSSYPNRKSVKGCSKPAFNDAISPVLSGYSNNSFTMSDSNSIRNMQLSQNTSPPHGDGGSIDEDEDEDSCVGGKIDFDDHKSNLNDLLPKNNLSFGSNNSNDMINTEDNSPTERLLQAREVKKRKSLAVEKDDDSISGLDMDISSLMEMDSPSSEIPVTNGSPQDQRSPLPQRRLNLSGRKANRCRLAVDHSGSVLYEGKTLDDHRGGLVENVTSELSLSLQNILDIAKFEECPQTDSFLLSSLERSAKTQGIPASIAAEQGKLYLEASRIEIQEKAKKSHECAHELFKSIDPKRIEELQSFLKMPSGKIKFETLCESIQKKVLSEWNQWESECVNNYVDSVLEISDEKIYGELGLMEEKYKIIDDANEKIALLKSTKAKKARRRSMNRRKNKVAALSKELLILEQQNSNLEEELSSKKEENDKLAQTVKGMESTLAVSNSVSQLEQEAYNAEKSFMRHDGLHIWAPTVLTTSNMLFHYEGTSQNSCVRIQYTLLGEGLVGCEAALDPSIRPKRSSDVMPLPTKLSGLLRSRVVSLCKSFSGRQLSHPHNIGRSLRDTTWKLARMEYLFGEIQLLYTNYNVHLEDRGDYFTIHIDLVSEISHCKIRASFDIKGEGYYYPFAPINLDVVPVVGKIDLDKMCRQISKSVAPGFRYLTRACDVMAASLQRQ